jgi:hypothetical protein
VKNIVTLQLFKSFQKVNFYTFKFENDEFSETNKFFTKLETDDSVKDDLEHLAIWLSLIGQKYGAKMPFFRHEASAHALPPPMSMMIREVIVNDLRLYCLRISDEIVILANGGIKKSQKVQDSPELISHFRFANVMSKQIDELIKEREIRFNGKFIFDLDEIELVY